MSQYHLILIAAVLSFPLITVKAEESNLKPGDLLPAITLENQHGKAINIDSQTRLLLFSADMGGGKLVRKVVEKHESIAALVNSETVRYLSDVSNMPSMIRRMMALPAMRKRPYPILLDTKGDTTANFPRQPETVTLIQVNQLTITNISYSSTAKQLAEALNTLE